MALRRLAPLSRSFLVHFWGVSEANIWSSAWYATPGDKAGLRGHRKPQLKRRVSRKQVSHVSLTKFVESKPIMRRILAVWPRPDFGVPKIMVAPPLTNNYSLVGTAFDYLVRAHLQKYYPQAEDKVWIAELSLNSGVELGIARHVQHEAKQIVAEAKACWVKFLNMRSHTDGFRFKLNDEFLISLLRLAKLDAIFRRRYVPPNLRTVEPLDIADLRQLYRALPEQWFGYWGVNQNDSTEMTIDKAVLLDPTFPVGSKLVGGADCDLILGQSLIDLKVVSNLKHANEFWAQMVGYAVLADLASKADTAFPKIKTIGLYFARHGHIWTYPAAKLYGSSRYPPFRKWFIYEAKRQFSSTYQRKPNGG